MHQVCLCENYLIRLENVTDLGVIGQQYFNLLQGVNKWGQANMGY